MRIDQGMDSTSQDEHLGCTERNVDRFAGSLGSKMENPHDGLDI